MNVDVDPATYYDETYKSYVLGWSRDHFHYGIWYDDTKSHQESLVNTTKEVISYLEISQDDIVLDAGCGTGGSSRYIANHHGARVTGIMLSEVLLNAAKSMKTEVDNPDLLEFYNMDFTDTIFEDETFTKIFGIDSICHALDKRDFAKEAYRLLQPGGKLVITDGYLIADQLTDIQRDKYQSWLAGWAVPSLATPSGFQSILKETGFESVQYHDKTEYVRKSVDRMYRNAKFSRIVYWMAAKLRLVPQSRYDSAVSAYLQKYLVDNNIVGYGTLYGEKPK